MNIKSYKHKVDGAIALRIHAKCNLLVDHNLTDRIAWQSLIAVNFGEVLDAAEQLQSTYFPQLIDEYEHYTI